MLLSGYVKDISLPLCNSNFQSVHCIAHLSEDISEAIPYLNAELGGYQYTKEPPSVTFRINGRLITLHSKKIAINALESAGQADKILEWLRELINDVWERRNEIEPSYKRVASPTLLDILKLLPKTNCKKCGQPTCLVFATQIMEGGKGPEHCPSLNETEDRKMKDYLKQFSF
ncbi:MAG: Fe-S cluster protein [Nitrospirae bacterium]|nr:Fe-S cluster protein [Nitrospirota bacterium]MBF0536199.1 Fe-S cluster protein [Nitrospirota bacterium]MBF0617325.1 Fe-S cluster protein [Nitrospirota bacterium]